MCLRYSSSVVAPTARSSPRASIGLSRLAASTAPSAAPAPTIVCSSSMNRMIWPSASCDLLEHGLEPVLELAAVLGAGDQRADVERDHAPVAQRLGHVAGDDPLREPLDDRGLADARLADQHRVVLRPPREHLDHAPDLVVAADDGVELALLGGLGQVAAELLERLVLLLGVLVGHAVRAAHLRRPPRRAARAWRRHRPAGRPRARAAGARSRRTRRPSRAPRRRPRLSTSISAPTSAGVALGSPVTVGSASSAAFASAAPSRRSRRRVSSTGTTIPPSCSSSATQQVLWHDLGVAARARESLRGRQGLLGLHGETICLHLPLATSRT